MIRNKSQILLAFSSKIKRANSLLSISLEEVNVMINRSSSACAKAISVDGSIENLINNLNRVLFLMKHSMKSVNDVILCIFYRKGVTLTISEISQISRTINEIFDDVRAYHYGYMEAELPETKRFEVMTIVTGLCDDDSEPPTALDENASSSIECRAEDLIFKYTEGDIKEEDFANAMFLISEELQSRYMIRNRRSLGEALHNIPYWLIDFIENHYKPAIHSPTAEDRHQKFRETCSLLIDSLRTCKH